MPHAEQRINLSQWCGAVFSNDRIYRYALWRAWSNQPQRVMNVLMLNPSTADETKNDPTVERCQVRAVQLGFQALIVTNLYALRSTDPKGLRDVPDPVGGQATDRYILEASLLSETVLCAWGNHTDPTRASFVLKLITEHQPSQTNKLMCLAKNFTGQPAHPLYFPYAAPLKPFTRSI